VQEVNTALSGSATGSDLRVNIELQNLKSARSPQQLIGAINNLYEALSTRLDVDLSPIYPIEVVRGEKTLNQYKKELYEKYGGDYTQHHHIDESTPQSKSGGDNSKPPELTYPAGTPWQDISKDLQSKGKVTPKEADFQGKRLAAEQYLITHKQKVSEKNIVYVIKEKGW
jgi:hypothetical protein